MKRATGGRAYITSLRRMSPKYLDWFALRIYFPTLAVEEDGHLSEKWAASSGGTRGDDTQLRVRSV